jgi:predicted metal-dependent phosphoesterase TrpH
MPTRSAVIDLHSHSTASDGEYPPEEVAARAAAAGSRVWALTDHDTVAGQDSALAAAKRLSMRFVPGIELSCFIDGREIHVLGHFVDPEHPTLKRFEDLLAEKRRARMEGIVRKLAALSVHVSVDDIVRNSGGKTIGRPHISRALVDRGYVSTVKEGFDRYLGEGKPAYVQRYRLSAEEGIQLVAGAGGVTTLAHPGVSKLERGDLKRLRESGLAGVEVFHPEHNPSMREKYQRIADEYDLVPTAGSDFHGERVAPDRHLGSESMSEAQLARLEARRP